MAQPGLPGKDMNTRIKKERLRDELIETEACSARPKYKVPPENVLPDSMTTFDSSLMLPVPETPSVSNNVTAFGLSAERHDQAPSPIHGTRLRDSLELQSETNKVYKWPETPSRKRSSTPKNKVAEERRGVIVSMEESVTAVVEPVEAKVVEDRRGVVVPMEELVTAVVEPVGAKVVEERRGVPMEDLVTAVVEPVGAQTVSDITPNSGNFEGGNPNTNSEYITKENVKNRGESFTVQVCENTNVGSSMMPEIEPQSDIVGHKELISLEAEVDSPIGSSRSPCLVTNDRLRNNTVSSPLGSSEVELFQSCISDARKLEKEVLSISAEEQELARESSDFARIEIKEQVHDEDEIRDLVIDLNGSFVETEGASSNESSELDVAHDEEVDEQIKASIMENDVVEEMHDMEIAKNGDDSLGLASPGDNNRPAQNSTVRIRMATSVAFPLMSSERDSKLDDSAQSATSSVAQLSCDEPEDEVASSIYSNFVFDNHHRLDDIVGQAVSGKIHSNVEVPESEKMIRSRTLLKISLSHARDSAIASPVQFRTLRHPIASRPNSIRKLSQEELRNLVRSDKYTSKSNSIKILSQEELVKFVQLDKNVRRVKAKRLNCSRRDSQKVGSECSSSSSNGNRDNIRVNVMPDNVSTGMSDETASKAKNDAESKDTMERDAIQKTHVACLPENENLKTTVTKTRVFSKEVSFAGIPTVTEVREVQNLLEAKTESETDGENVSASDNKETPLVSDQLPTCSYYTSPEKIKKPFGERASPPVKESVFFCDDLEEYLIKNKSSEVAPDISPDLELRRSAGNAPGVPVPVSSVCDEFVDNSEPNIDWVDGIMFQSFRHVDDMQNYMKTLQVTNGNTMKKTSWKSSWNLANRANKYLRPRMNGWEKVLKAERESKGRKQEKLRKFIRLGLIKEFSCRDLRALGLPVRRRNLSGNANDTGRRMNTMITKRGIGNMGDAERQPCRGKVYGRRFDGRWASHASVKYIVKKRKVKRDQACRLSVMENLLPCSGSPMTAEEVSALRPIIVTTAMAVMATSTLKISDYYQSDGWLNNFYLFIISSDILTVIKFQILLLPRTSYIHRIIYVL